MLVEPEELILMADSNIIVGSIKKHNIQRVSLDGIANNNLDILNVEFRLSIRKVRKGLFPNTGLSPVIYED